MPNRQDKIYSFYYYIINQSARKGISIKLAYLIHIACNLPNMILKNFKIMLFMMKILRYFNLSHTLQAGFIDDISGRARETLFDDVKY